MQALFKHAKNFVGGSRPIFEGIYYDGKSAYVTDEHVLIKVEHYPTMETGIFHYKTNKPIAGTYPNVDLFIPKQFKTELILQQEQIKAWERALKPALLIANKTYYEASFCSADNQITMRVTNEGSKYETTLPAFSDSAFDFETILLNCKYLSNILAFFKDCGAGLITVGINTRLSPIALKTDAGVLALLIPISPIG